MNIMNIDKITPSGIRMMDGTTEPATLPNLVFIATECDNQARGLETARDALNELYNVKRERMGHLNRQMINSMYGQAIVSKSTQWDVTQLSQQIDRAVAVMEGIDLSIKTIIITRTSLLSLGQTAKMLLRERGVII